MDDTLDTFLPSKRIFKGERGFFAASKCREFAKLQRPISEPITFLTGCENCKSHFSNKREASNFSSIEEKTGANMVAFTANIPNVDDKVKDTISEKIRDYFLNFLEK